MSLPTKIAVILSGQSLSDSVNLGGGKLVGIVCPTDLKGTGFSIKASCNNGQNWYDIYDFSKKPYIIPFSANAIIAGLDTSVTSSMPFVKLQSVNNAGNPVIELANRNITLIIR